MNSIPVLLNCPLMSHFADSLYLSIHTADRRYECCVDIATAMAHREGGCRVRGGAKTHRSAAADLALRKFCEKSEGMGLTTWRS